jgi:hypothetical protein
MIHMVIITFEAFGLHDAGSEMYSIQLIRPYLNLHRYADASGAGKDVYEHVSLRSKLSNSCII